MNNINDIYTQHDTTPGDKFNDSVEIDIPERKTINWLEGIKGTVLQIALANQNIDEKHNFYCFPSFVPFFETLIYKMPMWSPVMNNIFQSPNLNVSSSSCENQFKYVQRYLFEIIQTVRVDKFIFGHIRHIMEKLRLVVADENSYELKSKGW